MLECNPWGSKKANPLAQQLLCLNPHLNWFVDPYGSYRWDSGAKKPVEMRIAC